MQNARSGAMRAAVLAALAGFLIIGPAAKWAHADPPLPKPRHWDTQSTGSATATDAAAGATATGEMRDLSSRLQKAWNPPSKPVRGFASFTFDPAKPQPKFQVSVYNSSTNSEYDEAAKALLLKEASAQKWTDKSLPWHVTFKTDGSVKVEDRPPTVDFGTYMAAMQRAIKSNWMPPKKDTSKHVQAQFKIDYLGNVSDLHLTTTADDEVANEKALAAVRAVGKLPPLPAGSPDSVDIQFTFDYNVHERPKGQTAGGGK